MIQAAVTLNFEAASCPYNLRLIQVGVTWARFTQQSQPSVAAFIHYCFLIRDVAPDMMNSILPTSVSVTVSEMDSSELVEVSS
jgi:hypothetical protein